MMLRSCTMWIGLIRLCRIEAFNGDDCKDSCLKDCLCAVAIFRDGTCWKRGFLSRMARSMRILTRGLRKDNITLDGIPYVEERRKNQDELIRVGTTLLGTSVFVNILLAATVCVGFFFLRQRMVVEEVKDFITENMPDLNLRSFAYQELEEATNEFREELGRGAFGTVYKGTLDMDSSVIVIAVKKLNFVVPETEKEFKNEVNVIAQHITRILFDHPLRYKPQNILLDEYNNAKISDFGLAKLLMMNQSQPIQPLGNKRIVCCRKNVDMEIGEEGKEILTDWAYDCFTEGSLDMLVDYEVDALNDRKKLESYVKVSMWCIQENPCLRPNMRKVVQMLEGVVEVEDPPSPLPYSITTTI
ncbi:hypothetical protein F8388_005313 [Cannabis sativa]|uniref:Serine-threonine/tyrosine-protein kinase catalytic domain-containing protein n=1 Tax=Cannabis sativa TaxID=3483 RepID=A0A7J6ELE4_CANSA|nr:hypothetical protein F8388_005313 [Cannabis sativa]